MCVLCCLAYAFVRRKTCVWLQVHRHMEVRSSSWIDTEGYTVFLVDTLAHVSIIFESSSSMNQSRRKTTTQTPIHCMHSATHKDEHTHTHTYTNIEDV